MNRRVSLAIIDHVGIKAGMDYYTGLLAVALTRTGVNTFVFSNFLCNDPGVTSYQYFIGHTANKTAKALNYFKGFFKAAYSCRRHSCKDAVIHMFAYDLKELYSLFVLKLFGIQIIAIIHDVESFASEENQSLKKFILSHLDVLVVHNEFSAATLIGIDKSLKERLKIIPHGNFHALFAQKTDKAVARGRLGLKDDVFYLLFFGQIKRVKGLDILIQSMASLPDNIRLIIAGKPWKEDFASYETLIQSLNIGAKVVKMIRFIQDDERDLLFHAADILVLPYKQIFQSGVMLMAMSAKVPVLASDLQPMKELITNNETGFLFETGNVDSLSQTIEFIIKNPLLAESVMHNASVNIGAKNDWDKIALLYKELLNA